MPGTPRRWLLLPQGIHRPLRSPPKGWQLLDFRSSYAPLSLRRTIQGAACRAPRSEPPQERLPRAPQAGPVDPPGERPVGAPALCLPLRARRPAGWQRPPPAQPAGTPRWPLGGPGPDPRIASTQNPSRRLREVPSRRSERTRKIGGMTGRSRRATPSTRVRDGNPGSPRGTLEQSTCQAGERPLEALERGQASPSGWAKEVLSRTSARFPTGWEKRARNLLESPRA